MQKEVVYIDVDDDITAIIGKVKGSKEKIVALVPPKRIGVLQSAVNLRLLQRAARQSDKHLAIITGNSALVALAASSGIPTSKNLQEKPAIAAIEPESPDDENDVIDGSSIPVGDHAKQAKPSSKLAKEVYSAEMAAELERIEDNKALPDANNRKDKPARKKKPSVPDFNRFRKRMVIGGALLAVCIAFMVWAIVFAGRATVILNAKTSNEPINANVAVLADAKTSASAQTIKATVQTKTEEKTVNFTPTGSKDVGDKATGTVRFSTSSLAGLGTIPAGTKLTSTTGLVYSTDAPVTLTYSMGSGSVSGTTAVTAAENGSKYNAATGSMGGAPSSVSAVLTGPTSGGVTKMARVVTAADVETAKKQITEQKTDSVKSSLATAFPEGSKVIDESFVVEYKDVVAQPAVDAEAESGTVKMTAVYKLYGIAKVDLDEYLTASVNEKISKNNDQHIYKNGSDKAAIQDVTKIDGGAKLTLIATASVGPRIDEEAVKNKVLGMRYGEVQQELESINGIESVKVDFFPFWVSRVPSDAKKVTIEFKLDESN